ncbi:MAG: lytic transglycosylase domain-containing protein [Clostridia bacterium]|nr:lytic transglycosylase domain-containing protein [Clostridia bacterium]
MIAAIIRVESNFDPLARSNKGAIGLMQLLPKTAEYVAQIFKIGYDESDLLDGEKNIQIGVLYLSYLLDRFSLEWVIVAYNAGETITKKWIESGVSLNKIPYKETRDYYKKVVRAMKLYEFSGY